MMKTIILLAMAFACAMADVSAQYAGSTLGASTWNPPSLDGTAACSTQANTNYATVSFNITFPSAGVREIAAMAERNFKYSLEIYVYLGGFPTAPCTGLAHTHQLTTEFGFGGGPVIDDFVYFTAATYTFVVTGDVGGIFAVHVNPSDATGQITSGSPFWSLPQSDSSSTDSAACVEEESTADNAFATYTWTQGTTGQFDIFGLFVNESGLDYTYLTLYRGAPTTSELSINPCNTSATYLVSIESYSSGLYIPYYNLTAGVNYTVVLSLDYGYFGYWAVQVIPTRVRFFTPTGFTQPSRETSSSTVGCAASDDLTNAAYGVTFFTAEERVYVIDTASPPSPFSYIDTYSFLYAGLNTAVPPATCAGLVIQGDTGDITPVYAYTNVGQNYTVVVSTYSSPTIETRSAYVLYFFTGNPIGSIPTVTTTGGVTNGVITTGAAATTTGGVATTVGVATSNGGVTVGVNTVTTNGASAVVVSMLAVFAMISALL